MAPTSREEIQANNLLQATPLEHRNRLVKGLGQYISTYSDTGSPGEVLEVPCRKRSFQLRKALLTPDYVHRRVARKDYQFRSPQLASRSLWSSSVVVSIVLLVGLRLVSERG